MNCQECSEQLLAYAEQVLDSGTAQVVQRHLSECSGCRAEAEAIGQLRARLIRAGDAPHARRLDQSVMDQILIQQVELTRRLKMARHLHVFAMGGIAALLLIGVTWAALQLGPAPAVAKESEILARGIEAAANLKSIYIKCRMRTIPRDNFGTLDVNREFVDVELWKQFGPPLKWRVEKPGRVAAMDGRKTVMLIDNHLGVKIDEAAPSAFDTDWIHRLAAIDGVLSKELTTASLPGATVEAKRVENSDAADVTVVVRVDVNNQVGDYLKNKFLDLSSTRREYTFDRQSGRLKGLKIFCDNSGKDVLVLDVVKIDYDPILADSQFELQPPQDVAWYQPPQVLPDNEKYEKMTPAEAARTFFEACSKRDWVEVEKFWTMPIADDIKQYLGGLEVVRLGEPFQTKPYPGWFIPYEIRLNGGYVKKHTLSVRNDNPANRFVVDGGL